MKRRKLIDILRWQMKDYTFEVCIHSLHDMPFLRVMTSVVPNSWCVVMLSSGLGVFGDPVLFGSWDTLECALHDVKFSSEYNNDIRFISELNIHYLDCDIQHCDYEIWHLLPFDPYDHV